MKISYLYRTEVVSIITSDLGALSHERRGEYHFQCLFHLSKPIGLSKHQEEEVEGRL